MTGTPRKTTLTLVTLTTALTSLCALCPVSNALLLRPLVATVSPRYTAPDVEAIPFDRDGWRRGSARTKVGMARHLADHKLLDGLDRAALVEMLGEPDVERPGDEGTRWFLGYYAKGLFDESLWLELTIREDGRASGGIVGVSWADPRDR